jgi:acyl carrier protein
LNEHRLKEAFSRALAIPIESVSDALRYEGIGEWDSIAHMQLIAAIDQTFEIMMDTEDVLDLNSFAQAKVLLRKYNIEF